MNIPDHYIQSINFLLSINAFYSKRSLFIALKSIIDDVRTYSSYNVFKSFINSTKLHLHYNFHLHHVQTQPTEIKLMET